jgi:quercetin dioxygenase-like cupin family protein
MDIPYLYIPDLLAQLPEIPADTIVSRTYHSDGQVKAILFGFAPGQELSEHTASRPAILHFLKGEAQLALGGEAQRASAGTWIYMQPRLAHSIKAETELVMLLYLLEGGA